MSGFAENGHSMNKTSSAVAHGSKETVLVVVNHRHDGWEVNGRGRHRSIVFACLSH